MQLYMHGPESTITPRQRTKAGGQTYTTTQFGIGIFVKRNHVSSPFLLHFNNSQTSVLVPMQTSTTSSSILTSTKTQYSLDIHAPAITVLLSQSELFILKYAKGIQTRPRENAYRSIVLTQRARCR